MPAFRGSMGQNDGAGQLAASPAGRPTSEASSSPPETSRLTPESSGEEEDDDDEELMYDAEEEGAPADPLLRTGRGDVYELREERRKGRPGPLRLDDAYYRGTWSDEAGDEEEEEEEQDVVVVVGDNVEAITYTAEEEHAVVKKFDRRLVLFVALLYLLSFLDRSSMSLCFPCFSCFFLSSASSLLSPRGAMDPLLLTAEWSNPSYQC